MKMIAGLALFLFAALLAPGAAGTAEACSACGDDDGSVVTFVPVGRGSYGGVSDRRFIVVKDENEWKELWGEINGNVLPLPPLPDIDFSRHALAAVFQGLKRSGGYSISVEAIIETGDRVTVSVRERSRGPRTLSPWPFRAPGRLWRFPCRKNPYSSPPSSRKRGTGQIRSDRPRPVALLVLFSSYPLGSPVTYGRAAAGGEERTGTEFPPRCTRHRRLNRRPALLSPGTVPGSAVRR